MMELRKERFEAGTFCIAKANTQTKSVLYARVLFGKVGISFSQSIEQFWHAKVMVVFRRIVWGVMCGVSPECSVASRHVRSDSI